MMTLILVVLAIIGLLFFLVAAIRGRAASVTSIADLKDRTRAIDLAAFRNLINPAEEQYLRETLAPHDFNQVQRERIRAAIAYVDAVADNAAVLLRLGEAARRSANPQVAELALLLVNNALRVRAYAICTRTRFYAALVLPGIHVYPPTVTRMYEQLTGSASRLGYLQNSAPIQRTVPIL